MKSIVPYREKRRHPGPGKAAMMGDKTLIAFL
jgi:hypothetical protein